MEYKSGDRDPAADADTITNTEALQALVVEAALCGEGVRALQGALEAQLADAALCRPLWSAASVAPELLVQMMVAHSVDAGVQTRCCRHLSLAARRSDADNVAIAAVGGIEAVVAALTAHPEAEGVQQQGCRALGKMARNHSANHAIAAAGGIEAIVVALTTHPRAEGVQDKGCNALDHLVNDPGHQAAIKASGAIVLAQGTLERFPQGQAAVNARSLLGKLHD